MAETQSTKKELIYKQIPAIMAEIEAIGKDRENKGQGYKFRGIDDVYNMLHAILAKHKVFTTSRILEEHSEERPTKYGGVLIYRIFKILYTFYAEDGSHVETEIMGEGMDSGDKAAYKAMSGAHKYAFIQIFAIPTDEPKDPENDNPELEPKPEAKDKTPKKPALKPDKPGINQAEKESNEKLWKRLADKIREVHKALMITDKELEEKLKKAATIKDNPALMMKALKSLEAQFAEYQKNCNVPEQEQKEIF